MDPQLRQAIVTGRRCFWVPVAAFTLSLTVCYLVFWLSRDLPFESGLWQQQEPLRPRMVRSLLDEYQLEGMSRNEIDRMLGTPSGRDSIRQGDYIYWAGTDGVIDDMWLEIDFENDIAIAARHYPD